MGIRFRRPKYIIHNPRQYPARSRGTLCVYLVLSCSKLFGDRDSEIIGYLCLNLQLKDCWFSVLAYLVLWSRLPVHVSTDGLQLEQCMLDIRRPRTWLWNVITMTSQRRNDVFCQRWFDCLFNNLYRLKTKTVSKLSITDFSWGHPPITDRYPLQRVSNVESVHMVWFHDAFMQTLRVCRNQIRALVICICGIYECYTFAHRL